MKHDFYAIRYISITYRRFPFYFYTTILPATQFEPFVLSGIAVLYSLESTNLCPVDGWTIAFQANGPQGAWTTLWTGVDGPKRQPAHCPDHRDCPHPRAFAHAPHRAKGVTGSPLGLVLGEGLVSQGGQIDLDAPEPYGFGSRYHSIDRLEHSPASPLAFQHAGFCLPPELDEVEVVAGTHRGGHNQGFREAP